METVQGEHVRKQPKPRVKVCSGGDIKKGYGNLAENIQRGPPLRGWEKKRHGIKRRIADLYENRLINTVVLSKKT